MVFLIFPKKKLMDRWLLSMTRPCRIEKAFLPVTGHLETCKMCIDINQIGVCVHNFDSSEF